MASVDTRRFVRAEGALSRVLDEEAVLLDLATGTYFALDEVGTVAWASLEHGASAGEIADAIASRYEVSLQVARRDVGALLDELERRGLIREAEPR